MKRRSGPPRPRRGVERGVSRRRRRELPSAAGYPRVCAECGRAFVARRRTARWCSDKCRLRAWRHAAQSTDHQQIDRLRQQVEVLRNALQAAQGDNLCASAGCQLARAADTNRSSSAPGAAPWRDPDWNSTPARELRQRLTRALQDVDRLRDENVLMRRWIMEHRTDHTPNKPGKPVEPGE